MEEEQVKVVVNHITPQTVEFFDPQDNSLGFVNEYTFGDVKVQIAENRLSGYYVKFEGRKLRIDHFGTLEDLKSFINSYGAIAVPIEYIFNSFRFLASLVCDLLSLKKVVNP